MPKNGTSLTRVPVHSLWVGRCPLGLLQQLTIRSFQDQRHPFILWTYNPNLEVPAGTQLRDAEEVLPSKEIFQMQGGAHAGSFAFFSDRFCLALLVKQGGCFVQMDVTCLRPLDFTQPFLFAPHFQCGVGAYVMKGLPGSPIFRHILDRHASVFRPDHYDWHASMKLMGDAVKMAGLEAFIGSRTQFPDDSPPYESYFLPNAHSPPSGRYVHHWCDSATSSLAAVPRVGSFYHALLKHYRSISEHKTP